MRPVRFLLSVGGMKSSAYQQGFGEVNEMFVGMKACSAASALL